MNQTKRQWFETYSRRFYILHNSSKWSKSAHFKSKGTPVTQLHWGFRWIAQLCSCKRTIYPTNLIDMTFFPCHEIGSNAFIYLNVGIFHMSMYWYHLVIYKGTEQISRDDPVLYTGIYIFSACKLRTCISSFVWYNVYLLLHWKAKR